jgi:hypothetical protein
MSAPDADLQLDQGDVLVEDYEPDGCDNDGCGSPVTKAVSLDLRSIGEKVCIGIYCAKHAAEMAESLRGGLPPGPRGEEGR